MGKWLKPEFLLGIGVGCILSALLLSVFGLQTLSDQEIMDRAAKLGMVKQDKPSTGSQGSEPPGDTKTTEQPKTAEQPKTSEQPKTTEQTQTTEHSAANEKESVPAATNTNGSTTAITITDRMGSESVARLLAEKGVIENKQEFLEIVIKNKAQRKLQTGTFIVPVGGDLEEILDILLGKKK